MKKRLFLLIACLFLLCACGSDATDVITSQEGVEQDILTETAITYIGLHVDGTKLLDVNGNEIVMKGINHAHSWYRDQDVTAIEAIAKLGANSIRIVLSDGEQWQKDSKEELDAIIECCKENNLIAILEVHDATGYDDIESLEKAAAYWCEVKEALIGQEEYVILNIANEWVGKWDGKVWKNGYTEVIPMLREAGINNLIMVDAAGWGQYGKSIKEYGMDVFESDPQRNVIFSVHMYGTAGKNEKTIKDNLTGVTNQNLCVCVGEFGYTHSDGDVDEQFLMDYCKENKIGCLAWSWKGNSGGVEYLDLANEWDGSSLSADWGEPFAENFLCQ